MSTSTAQTYRVAAPDPTLREALQLATIFAVLKLALHIATNLWETHIGYGYFRDEFYYLICGRHLAWGYVDHGPIVALQARLAETIFGHSITGIRMFSAAAGAARVFLTGLLAWSLGGRRPSQSLAMLCVLLAPQYLGLDSYLSMNSFESMFWMPCLLALILLQSERLSPSAAWTIVGISAGIGLLNKPSMVFFLVALSLALLCTPQRRMLFTRHAALGIALLTLIAEPNLIWQIHNHWPTLEFLHNGRVEGKNLVLGPIPFVLTQIKNMGPLSIFVWISGVIWLVRRPAHRWLGLTWLIFFGILFALHAKDYYLAPIYPILFAAGGLAWEQRAANRRSVQRNSAFAFPVGQTMILLAGLFLLPMAIPVFTPQTWIAWAKATHLYGQSATTENEDQGPLPQFYADRFGWQEEVDQLRSIYNSLSPEDRKHVVIKAQNYGEAASAIFLTKPGELPPVISGHNNFYLWGPQGATGDVVILIEHSTPERLKQFYDHCEIAGHMGHPLGMPFENRPIFLCRGRKINLTTDWQQMKFYY